MSSLLRTLASLNQAADPTKDHLFLLVPTIHQNWPQILGSIFSVSSPLHMLQWFFPLSTPCVLVPLLLLHPATSRAPPSHIHLSAPDCTLPVSPRPFLLSAPSFPFLSFSSSFPFFFFSIQDWTQWVNTSPWWVSQQSLSQCPKPQSCSMVIYHIYACEHIHVSTCLCVCMHVYTWAHGYKYFVGIISRCAFHGTCMGASFHGMSSSHQPAEQASPSTEHFTSKNRCLLRVGRQLSESGLPLFLWIKFYWTRSSCSFIYMLLLLSVYHSMKWL